ncbi:hypothetical protein D3C79_939790 [compost metagenome]
MADTYACAVAVLTCHEAPVKTFQQRVTSLYKQGALWAAANHQFPVLQAEQSLLLIESQVHCTAGIELHQRTIGKREAASFTRAGGVVRRPGADRIEVFAQPCR